MLMYRKKSSRRLKQQKEWPKCSSRKECPCEAEIQHAMKPALGAHKAAGAFILRIDSNDDVL